MRQHPGAATPECLRRSKDHLRNGPTAAPHTYYTTSPRFLQARLCCHAPAPCCIRLSFLRCVGSVLHGVFVFHPAAGGGGESSRCAVVKTYMDGGKMAEYEKMYAVFVRRGRHGSGAYRAKRRHSAGDRNTSGRAGQSRKHVHRRLMKKIRCPTGERQRIFCGFLLQYTAD